MKAYAFVTLVMILAGSRDNDRVVVADTVDDSDDNVRVLDLRVSNTLKCDVPDDLDDLPVAWTRDGKNILEFNTEADPRKFEIVDDDLVIRRTVDEDVDTYTCTVTPKDGAPFTRNINTVSKPFIKINAPPVFIEGQKMKLECIAYGTPTPEISWRVNNETFEETKDRVRLSPNSLKQKNGIFEIDVAELSDRGDYVCVASNEATFILNTTVELESYVRVKDKMAAVWPFIGICAEVIILCAIIFAYERNRTKVRNFDENFDG